MPNGTTITTYREIPISPTRPGEEPGTLTGVIQSFIYTVDHKKIGLLYFGTGLFFFVVAGLMAAAIRIQLAIPDNDFLAPEVYNRFFTMHGTAMVFYVGMPLIFGLANYFVPLMIGARDMAFPRLNAFGFWVFFFSGVLFYFSYLGAPGLYGAAPPPTSAGSPTRRSPRRRSRAATRPTIGRSACYSAASAASAPRSTSSSRSSVCVARA